MRGGCAPTGGCRGAACVRAREAAPRQGCRPSVAPRGRCWRLFGAAAAPCTSTRPSLRAPNPSMLSTFDATPPPSSHAPTHPRTQARFLAVTKPEMLAGREELEILVSADKDNNTITIECVAGWAAGWQAPRACCCSSLHLQCLHLRGLLSASQRTSRSVVCLQGALPLPPLSRHHPTHTNALLHTRTSAMQGLWQRHDARAAAVQPGHHRQLRHAQVHGGHEGAEGEHGQQPDWPGADEALGQPLHACTRCHLAHRAGAHLPYPTRLQPA